MFRTPVSSFGIRGANTVNTGHPLWATCSGLWTFDGIQSFNHILQTGVVAGSGSLATCRSRVGSGLYLNTSAVAFLNRFAGIGGSGSTPYQLSREGYLPQSSCTVFVIRRKTDLTLRAAALFGIDGTTNGRRLNAHWPYSDGMYSWQFGGVTLPNSLVLTEGALKPAGNTQNATFTQVTLGSNSTLSGWYFLTGATNNYNPIWGKDGSNEIYFGSGASAGKVAVVKAGATIAQSTGTVSQNVWQHLAITDDGSAIKIYLNGADIGNSVGYTTMSGMQLTRTNQGQNGNNFIGRFDELGIWSRALSGSEVTGLHNSGAPQRGDVSIAPWSTNLVAGWHCDSQLDFSGGGNNLTFNNGITSGVGIVPGGCRLTTDLETWAFVAGKRGMAVYQNGRLLESHNTAVTRTSVGEYFNLNGASGSASDDQEYYLMAVLESEWTAAQAMWAYMEPWSCFAPKPKWSALASAAGSSGAKPWYHYQRLMMG